MCFFDKLLCIFVGLLLVCCILLFPPRHPKLGLNVGFGRISWLILRERLCFVGAWVSVDLFTWAATDIPVCDVPPAFDSINSKFRIKKMQKSKKSKKNAFLRVLSFDCLAFQFFYYLQLTSSMSVVNINSAH